MSELITYKDQPKIEASYDRTMKSRLRELIWKDGLHAADIKMDNGNIVKIRVLIESVEVKGGSWGCFYNSDKYTFTSYHAWALRQLFPDRLSPKALIMVENEEQKIPFHRSLWLASYVNAVLHCHTVTRVRQLLVGPGEFGWLDHKEDRRGWLLHGGSYMDDLLDAAGIEYPEGNPDILFIENFV